MSLTLADCQRWVEEMMAAKGWEGRSLELQAMMMAEEMGEVCKAVRGLVLKGETPERKQELAHELADVLNYTCWLASKTGVDLEAAFREKFDINAKRVWK